MLSQEELGLYLEKVRKELNISLREVNKLTDISYSHLSMIEHGKRKVTPALLRNLANLYKLDYIDLYEKAGYIDLAESEKMTREKYKNVIFTDGLSEEQVKRVISYIDFIRMEEEKERNEKK